MRIWILFLALVVNGYGVITVDIALTSAAINSWHSAASDGDTGVLAAGTSGDLSTAIVLSKAVTLRGHASGSTLTDDMGNTGNWLDKALIQMQLPQNQKIRVSGITFVDGSTNYSSGKDGGVIYVSDTNSNDGSQRGIVDNCTFTNLQQHSGIIRVNGAFGVTSNCHFDWATSGFGHIILHSGYLGDDGDGGNGDGSFNDEAHWGTDKFWFIEGCTHDRSGQSIRETVDNDRGARWVYRHNTDTNTRLATHGTDSGTFYRSNRAFEAYGNAISGDGSQSRLLNLRGGTALIHANALTNYAVSSKIADLQYYRVANDAFSWLGADGITAWDNIDLTDGPQTPGGAGDGVFYSGTATGSGTREMTDTSQSWDDDELIGYTIHQTSGTGEDLDFGYIIDNDGDTIFWAEIIPGFGGNATELAIAVSDGYEIRKVIAGLDMPGLGKGDLADTDVVSPVWLNQVADPIHSWGNTINGVSNNTLTSNTVWIIDGTHYYDDGTEPSGYTPYPYPHPLLADGDGPFKSDGSGAVGAALKTDGTGALGATLQ